jgi:hypothetical protein
MTPKPIITFSLRTPKCGQFLNKYLAWTPRGERARRGRLLYTEPPWEGSVDCGGHAHRLWEEGTEDMMMAEEFQVLGRSAPWNSGDTTRTLFSSCTRLYKASILTMT